MPTLAAAAKMPTREPAPRPAKPRAGARHMRLSRAIEEFLTELQIERSLLTYKAYKADLKFLEAVATTESADKIAAFTPAIVRAYFKRLADKGHSAEYMLRRRSALSEFAKWCVRRRLLTDNPMLEAAPRIKRPRRKPRPFSREERQRLLALELSPEETTLRGLLCYAGLRVSEVAGLRWRNVRLTAPEQRGAIRVVGKGNKERIVPMLRDLDAILRAWLAVEPATRRMLEGGLVLERKGLPLRVRRIEYIVAKWGRQAEVSPCVPHRWRHTAATLLFELGMDAPTIQRILGHESIATTMQYVDLADDAMERAMAAVEERLRGGAGFSPQVIYHPETLPAKGAE